MKEKDLQIFAEKIRLESIKSMASCGGGHVGGVLSMAELAAVLYGRILRIKPKNPLWKERDRLVLSKGHCGAVLYAALALCGYFSCEELQTLNKNGSNLPGHCNMFHTPGVDSGTGSLGQGGSIAAGMALGLRLQNKDSKVYVIFGDGECNEGQIWETALFAAHHKLDNLIGFVDRNHQQLDGHTANVCEIGDLRKKFEDFGWYAVSVDGHDVAAIRDAIEESLKVKSMPKMIVLETVKGKGWSLTEGKTNIHHITISAEQLKHAEEEISARMQRITEKR